MGNCPLEVTSSPVEADIWIGLVSQLSFFKVWMNSDLAMWAFHRGAFSSFLGKSAYFCENEEYT